MIKSKVYDGLVKSLRTHLAGFDNSVIRVGYLRALPQREQHPCRKTRLIVLFRNLANTELQ